MKKHAVTKNESNTENFFFISLISRNFQIFLRNSSMILFIKTKINIIWICQYSVSTQEFCKISEMIKNS